jgi:hypothetical protein
MSEPVEPQCPECNVDRRDFVRLLGAGALAVAAGVGLPGRLRAREKKSHPAEDLVKELFTGMTAEQKKMVCRPFEDPARLSVNPNKALDKTISTVYTKPQQELLDRIVKAISSGDDGYRLISRGSTWDASREFGNCGANLFGEPGKGQFAFLFTGHHLTVRCDGDFADGVGFGGPIYYGHSPNGWSNRNLFYPQTKEVMSVYEALNEEQRKKGLITMGHPGEGAKSIQLRGKDQPKPGIACAELSKDQQELVGKVMRAILSPFRKEDSDEVMAIIKETGGLEKIQLAFYSEEYEGAKTDSKQPWSFWRLEGPGLIWNFRVLPHVHTYVNISSKI